MDFLKQSRALKEARIEAVQTGSVVSPLMPEEEEGVVGDGANTAVDGVEVSNHTRAPPVVYAWTKEEEAYVGGELWAAIFRQKPTRNAQYHQLMRKQYEKYVEDCKDGKPGLEMKDGKPRFNIDKFYRRAGVGLAKALGKALNERDDEKKQGPINEGDSEDEQVSDPRLKRKRVIAAGKEAKKRLEEQRKHRKSWEELTSDSE